MEKDDWKPVQPPSKPLSCASQRPSVCALQQQQQEQDEQQEEQEEEDEEEEEQEEEAMARAGVREGCVSESSRRGVRRHQTHPDDRGALHP